MKDRYYQLRNKAWDMPTGKQKLTLLEESVRIADQYLTRQDAFQARMTYGEAALEAGHAERLLVSFAWCLSEFEKHPGEYSSYLLLWHYKWVVNQIWRFPQIPTERIERIFEDFKAKCLEQGYGLNAYYKYFHVYSLYNGRVEDAAKHYEKWRKARRDALSDCKACDQNDFGLYHVLMGRHKRALQSVKPILDGRLTCAEVPQNTYGNILLSLLETGDFEQAAAIAKKGQRLLDGQRFMNDSGKFMEYFSAVDLAKAQRIYERTIRYALDTKVDWNRFRYLLSARIFMQRWHSVRKHRKALSAPEHVTLDWIVRETDRLAEVFDARNRNSYYTDLIVRKTEQVERLSRKYDTMRGEE
ncbi:hypothetical protein [Paenibacillus thermotolerans]|uniref:hypothetical protein n=1 Tax=Paenibacillus thermotolerans TaxID=3027807 RepID=UPI002368A26B|nr:MULTISPECIES: hypothetical protein [unclassified Paenibacillus]